MTAATTPTAMRTRRISMTAQPTEGPAVAGPADGRDQLPAEVSTRVDADRPVVADHVEHDQLAGRAGAMIPRRSLI
jgi:hypothetical protein